MGVHEVPKPPFHVHVIGMTDFNELPQFYGGQRELEQQQIQSTVSGITPESIIDCSVEMLALFHTVMAPYC